MSVWAKTKQNKTKIPVCQLFKVDLINGGMEMLSPEREEGGPVSGSVFAKRSARVIYLTEAVTSGTTAAVLYEGPRNCVSSSQWSLTQGENCSPHQRAILSRGRLPGLWLLYFLRLSPTPFTPSEPAVQGLPGTQPVSYRPAPASVCTVVGIFRSSVRRPAMGRSLFSFPLKIRLSGF